MHTMAPYCVGLGDMGSDSAAGSHSSLGLPCPHLCRQTVLPSHWGQGWGELDTWRCTMGKSGGRLLGCLWGVVQESGLCPWLSIKHMLVLPVPQFTCIRGPFSAKTT